MIGVWGFPSVIETIFALSNESKAPHYHPTHAGTDDVFLTEKWTQA